MVTTPKQYKEAIENYGVMVANLMWDYCRLIKIQSLINGDSPYIRRKRQAKACALIVNDIISYGDPRALNPLVIGDLWVKTI